MWEKKGNIYNRRHAQVPVVDEYKTFYRIYYSTRINGRSLPVFIDVDKDDLSKILNDNLEPILTLGDPGSFDWAGIMPTDIINYQNKKYLYYIGWSVRNDVPYHNNLGLAVSSDDGKTWNKFSTGPVFHTSHKEPGYIGTVEIMLENDIWRMWYLSCRKWIEYNGKMEPIYDIKYAESINGIDWDPKGITCIPLEGDEGGITAARVIKINNLYKMWYSVRDKTDYRENPEHSYRIKAATSRDGLVWEKSKEVELDISKESDWDNIMVCYPFIVQKKDLLIMLYNGNQFGKSGIGWATLKL